MPVFNNILAGAAGSGGAAAGYKIERSLRFNKPDSAYLNQTFSAGNRRTWTWSGWVKLTDISGGQSFLFGAAGGFQIYFANNKIYLDGDANGGSGNYWTFITTQVFRDPAAWYHFVFVHDTTQSAANDRFKIYVNGVQLTDFDTNNRTNLTQNSEGHVNNNVEHRIGRQPGTSVYANFYLAENHFVDGQALAPTDFGELDSNNVWQPKEFTGSYTQNSPNDGTTWSSYWTGNLRGTGLYGPDDSFDGDGNQTYPSSGAGNNCTWTVPTAFPSTDTIEINIEAGASHPVTITRADNTTYDITTNGVQTLTGGLKAIRLTYDNGPAAASSLTYVKINGFTLLDGVNETGANSFHLDFSDNSSNAALGTDSSGNSNTWTVNNLVAAAAGLSTANQGFGIVEYTGNQSSRSFDLGFQPDFVWIKAKAAGFNHQLFDSVRGVTKTLNSNTTSAEATAVNSLTAFNSNGFSLGSDNNGDVNGGGPTNYIAWAWKAGGTAVSNTYGTITSSVSANNTYGFSIVTYTGDGNNSKTVGHSLNSAPKMVFYKRRDASGNWKVYHESTGAGSLGELNSSGTISTNGDIGTAPTSSVIAVSSSGSTYLNDNNGTYVAYCWSEIPGFSKFGSFTHSSTTSLDLGFKPKFFLIKETDGTTPWYLFDAERDSFDDPLFPNTNGAEGNGFAFTANDSGISWVGGSLNAGTYVYAAFAEKPDGSIIDSLIDTPTNYEADSGNNGGNYATLNPLITAATTTLRNGNLEMNGYNGASSLYGTIGISSGKYYWETTFPDTGAMTGVAATPNGSQYPGGASDGYAIDKDNKYNNNSASSFHAFAAGSVVGCAFDADNGTLTFYDDGVSAGTAFTSIPAGTYFPIFRNGSSTNVNVNFGQRPFAFTPPTGFKSLCTQNLADPTIADGSTAFDIDLYTGTNASLERSNFAFSPDLLWFKSRNAARTHVLIDTVRGRAKALESNTNGAEYTSDANRDLVSFDSDGFTVGQTQHFSSVNRSGDSIVVWGWDAGTSTVSNTDGSITSNVRANPSAGFSISTYTGTGSTSTFGHGLNATPELVIVKSRSNSQNWSVQHSALGPTYYLYLQSTNAASTFNGGPFWNNTAPTSSVVTVGSDNDTNATGYTYVAYCFAPVEGYSAFGSYTGNGDADGSFVYTGFKIAYLVIKCTSHTSMWSCWDTARDVDNFSEHRLKLDQNTAEESGDSNIYIDLLSNGFKTRAADTDTNGSGRTYIYMAFAEHPFKTARAR